MFGISIKKSVAVGISVGLMGFASQASALTETDALGLVNDGIPSNPENEVVYINTLIDQPLGSGPTQVGTEFYTRTGNTCDGGACPDAVLAGATKDDTDPSTTVNVTGFEYLLGKYDAANAGSLVWYVGDLTGNQTIPGSFSGHGLSHWSLYNAGDTPPNGNPEPMSLALLALGLLGLGFARRRVAS